jgi:hypothetical protein
MALDLLRRLAAQPPPRTVDDRGEVALLHALRAAGLVMAIIPQPMRISGRPFQLPAKVQLVTREGWDALLIATPQKPTEAAMPVRPRTRTFALPQRR